MGVRVADILAAGDCTVFARSVPGVVRRAYRAIIDCHTHRMGGHAVVCSKGHVQAVSYNACRNRNCPHCAWYRVRKWLERKARTLLGCAHHHIIFTIPHELNPLWLLNYKLLAMVLFRSARAALFELAADPQYLGAQPGVVMALHTWGQQLPLHPHLHCLASAGGAGPDGRWVAARRILLPAQPLKELFRGRFLYEFRGLVMQDALRLPDDWNRDRALALCVQLEHKRWNVRVCERYDNPKAVLSYLGRYLNGGPMGEGRLLRFNGRKVAFRYRDYRDVGPEGPRQKELELDRNEFVRRYLQHVPPTRFHMVRSYGLYRTGGNTGDIRRRLRETMPPHEELRHLLEEQPEPQSSQADAETITHCALCGSPLRPVSFLPRAGPLQVAA